MPRYLSYLFGSLTALLLVCGPILFAFHEQAQIRNFHVVRKGVLYRSGQLSQAGLERVIHDYGINTVITLRDAMRLGDPPPDLQEEKYCRAHDINYERISPRSWWSPDGSIPAEVGVRQFRAVMDNPDNYPVLIHCFAGIHRTGAFCAIYRMEYEGWTNAEAIEELRACGYSNLDDEWDILGYLEQYRRSRGKTQASSSSAPVGAEVGSQGR
jgi:protein tyrosine/serine phosphatase